MSDRERILRNNQLFWRFNAALYLEGNSQVSLSLQPFINLAFQKMPLTGLEEALGLDNTEAGGVSFHSFGISLVFYNGPQN